MKASICYITCDNHPKVQQTFTALQQYTPNEHEIVILQNGNLLSQPLIRDVVLLHTSERLGIPQARNYCIQHSTGEVIIWIDDDVEVVYGFVEAFLNPFIDDANVGFVGYETLIINENFWGQWFIDINDTNGNFDYFDSPYAISKSMLDDIGWYDEQTGPLVCDNTDLCLRAWQSGKWKLKPIQNIGLRHWHGSTTYWLIRSKIITTLIRSQWTIKVVNYMQQKHPAGWHMRYNIPYSPFIIDKRLQFPELTGRLGGPEDKQWLKWDLFTEI